VTTETSLRELTGKTPAKWTIMVYLAGDNNLSMAGEADLAEMRSVGSTPDVHVVAEFDCAGEDGTRRFRVERRGAGEQVEAIGETDSGDPSTLERFVGWAVERYPAKRYALILWNHGGGWAPAEIERLAKARDAAGFDLREAGERASTGLGRLLFRSSWQRILDLRTPAERAVCSDDGSGHSLDAVELGRVLGAIATRLGRPLDFLGLDACLMSCIESAFEAGSRVAVMAAAEEAEPAGGWPFGRVLGALAAEPGMTARGLGARVVAEYVDDLRRKDYGGAVTIAALDLRRLGRLVDALNSLARALIDSGPGAAATVWKAQRDTPHFCRETQWDLARLAENIARLASGDEVRTAAKALREELRPAAAGPVIASAASGPGVAGCGGLSIYMPPLVRVSPYYGDLAFARSSRWPEWLAAYRAALPGGRP
jgi:hypothetical protein